MGILFLVLGLGDFIVFTCVRRNFILRFNFLKHSLIGDGITDEDKAHFRAMKNRYDQNRYEQRQFNNNVPSEQNSANSDQRLFTRISQSSHSLHLNNNNNNNSNNNNNNHQYNANNMTPPPSSEKVDQNNNSLINSIESIKRAAISWAFSK